MPEDKRNAFQAYTQDSAQKGQQSRRSVGQMRASPSWQSGGSTTPAERLARNLGNAFNDAGASMMSRSPLRQLENRRYQEQARIAMIEEQRQRDAYLNRQYKDRLAGQTGMTMPEMPLPEGAQNWTPEEHQMWRKAMATRVKRERDYNAGKQGY